MTRKLRLLVPVFLLAAAPSALRAQANGGPSLDNAAVGIRAATARPATDSSVTPSANAAAKPPAPLVPPRVDTNQNRAMMIVGGAAFIAGAIIGDTPGTIIMVGGAGLGLFGLYKYLE